MPVYLYYCPNCGEYIEITKPFSDVDKKEYCEFCLKETGDLVELHRILSSTSVIYKGRGFYTTDNVERIKKRRQPEDFE